MFGGFRSFGNFSGACFAGKLYWPRAPVPMCWATGGAGRATFSHRGPTLHKYVVRERGANFYADRWGGLRQDVAQALAFPSVEEGQRIVAIDATPRQRRNSDHTVGHQPGINPHPELPLRVVGFLV